MGFGGTCRAAATVASCAAADENNDIAWLRNAANDVFTRGSGDDGTQFKTFRHETGVVDFLNFAGGQTDLIAVGGITSGGGTDDLTLRKFAGQRVFQRCARICRARDTHGLIDVGTTRQRVADGSAEACRRATERLDFRRMVVGLVLVHDEPFLLFAVHISGDGDGAGIDFVRSVQIIQLAEAFQFTCADGGYVHEAERLILPTKILAKRFISGIGVHDRLRERRQLEFDFVDGRMERRMAAVIRPVGVDDADFGEGRIAFLLIAEILLAEGEIFCGHGHAEFFHHVLNLLFRELTETINDSDVRWPIGLHFKRIWLVQRGLAGFDGINEMLFDFFKIGSGNGRVKGINRCGSENGAFLLSEELDALRGGIRPLVILAGEGFNGEKL